LKDLVGSADVVAGEPLIISPRIFRQNRAWMNSPGGHHCKTGNTPDPRTTSICEIVLRHMY